jgi:hypothetical protein
MFLQNKQRVRLCLAFVAALIFVGSARSQTSRIGEVRNLTVVTLALQVGSTERESKQVTYTPPPGWFVRGHVVDCTVKRGNSSYTVSTVPRDWNWLSEDDVRESYKTVIDLAGKVHGPGAETKFSLEQEELLRELKKVRATHHALVVEATARGEGFLRGGGCVELTVNAELVYLGTNEDVKRVTAAHKSAINSQGKVTRD